MATKGLPVAVRNLRRIWNEKKEKFEITQTTAAKKLGWTQGAFSQYLNNITELNDDAIVKLANFLEVDPNEIDPNYSPLEAERIRIPIRFIHGNTAKITSETQYRRRVVTTVMESNTKATCGVKLEKNMPPLGYKGQIILCSDMFILPKPHLAPDRKPEWYIVKLKNKDSLTPVRISECPPDNQLEAKLMPIITYLVN